MLYTVTDRNIAFLVPLSPVLPVEHWKTSCKYSSLPVDRKYQKGQSRDNYTIVLYLMHIKKDILAFYWLRFVM